MQHLNTILVPIDYSESANNALEYAVELAKTSGAKIVLLHVYHPPAPTGEAPIILITPQDLEEANLKELQVVESDIAARLHSRTRVESIVRSGFTGEEIAAAAHDKHADLIVMGITGGGKLAQALIGSNAVTTIRESGVPVLTIPADATYRAVKTIVMAYDCTVELGSEAIAKLKFLVNLFHAQLVVVDVVDPEKVPDTKMAVAGVKLERSLQDIPHLMVFPASQDVTGEINASVKAHEADWLVMIPHKHNFIRSLFHKSNTKEVAFHTHIPLLTLHE